MTLKRVVYIARIANKDSVGIINKVSSTADALCELGYKADAVIIHERWFTGSMKVAARLCSAKEDLVILRSDHHTMLLLFFPMLLLRMRKIKLVVDVANPVSVAVREIDGFDSPGVLKLVRKLWLYISFPLSLMASNRILQYGPESKWFRTGLDRKIKMVGNGVAVNSIPFRAVKPKFDQSELNFIGVGYLAYWHGYDRLIRSIHSYNIKNRNNPKKCLFTFKVIGEGFERANLISLVRELNLEEHVKFLGTKTGEELAACFENAHIGVCSLARFRKNVSCVSEIKSKDYVARGIPFVLAYKDLDFDAELPFLYTCKNDDSLIDLEKLICWYTSLNDSNDSFSFMREFAVRKLDFTVKLKEDIVSII